MSKHETMGSTLRAMAARVDAMEKEMAKIEHYLDQQERGE
jgi:hypothetical protein